MFRFRTQLRTSFIAISELSWLSDIKAHSSHFSGLLDSWIIVSADSITLIAECLASNASSLQPIIENHQLHAQKSASHPISLFDEEQRVLQVKNLQVRDLKSSFARNFNLCFRSGEFGFGKWKSTRRKCLHLLDVVLNFEILANEKWSVSVFAIVIASVSATVSAHKWTNLPCASFQIERGVLIATVVYHQSIFCSLCM